MLTCMVALPPLPALLAGPLLTLITNPGILQQNLDACKRQQLIMPR